MDHAQASGATREKALELAQIAQQAVAGTAAPSLEQWLRVIDNFASIRPPKWDTTIGLLVMRSGGRESYSVKPGNITMNMRKLATAISQGALTTAAALKAPWMAIFGAIVLWNSLYTQAKVELSENEGSVLWTMWHLKDQENTVATDGLLEAVNGERLKYGGAALTERQFKDALTRLEKIQTIERFAKFGSRWWLREWVSVDYQ
jgi:hypothetical protein